MSITPYKIYEKVFNHYVLSIKKIERKAKLDILNFQMVMLTNVLKALVNNPVKKSFYKKRNKSINILAIFFIFHKSDVKTFLKLIVNQ